MGLSGPSALSLLGLYALVCTHGRSQVRGVMLEHGVVAVARVWLLVCDSQSSTQECC